MSFGEKIKKIREDLRLSQAEFADALKIKSQSTISKFERGAVAPSLKTAKRIIDLAKSKKLKITLNDIFLDE